MRFSVHEPPRGPCGAREEEAGLRTPHPRHGLTAKAALFVSARHSQNTRRAPLTSDGKANVQDCWKGQDPELSTWMLKSTEAGARENTLVPQTGKCCCSNKRGLLRVKYTG